MTNFRESKLGKAYNRQQTETNRDNKILKLFEIDLSNAKRINDKREIEWNEMLVKAQRKKVKNGFIRLNTLLKDYEKSKPKVSKSKKYWK